MEKQGKNEIVAVDGNTPDQIRKEAARQIVNKPSLISSALLSSIYKDVVFEGGNGIKGISTDEAKNELEKLSDRIISGDLSDVEALLGIQIELLSNFTARYLLDGFDKHSNCKDFDKVLALLSVGLKFQEQTRKTAATLASIKSPRKTAFIKQQVNHANNQQVINGPQVNQKTEKIVQTLANELMEDSNCEEWMDARKIAPAVRTNSEMETVGKIYRAKD